MTIGDSIATKTIGARLWLYSNYHCNLACSYCLTSSSRDVPKRELAADIMLALVDEAATLGFRSVGITGGEPFVRADMPDIVAAVARRLPVVVLTNGTMFTPRFVARLAPLATLPAALQVSLDSADPAANDALRGRGTYARVIAGIRTLRAAAIKVRIGSTVDDGAGAALEPLCELHRSLGILDADHVVRPVVRRGRAADHALGIAAQLEDLPAELTLTVDGAFWSPASPTVRNGRLDIGELLTRTIAPLRIPAEAMLRYASSGGMPQGTGLVA
ncbi:MAG: radical SAM protein [Candidatus Eremiobacteraeota bacterium]|nr:radical SAM protein [Candidatus Eremiobacteraeota bacterium]MBC5801852.1 radical SAM protein [Candidatus Eremiobacteraeota bacterium]MBC5820994.1 radical SAM protein [Candidatus Eremiobacteraeota bacterium]